MFVLLGAGVAFPLHLQSAFPAGTCSVPPLPEASIVKIINNNNKMSFLSLHYLFCRFTINLSETEQDNNRQRQGDPNRVGIWLLPCSHCKQWLRKFILGVPPHLLWDTIKISL